MGASSSCRIFEKVSDSLKYALTDFFKVSHVVKLLDDFLFIGKSLEDCTYGRDSFRKLCTLTGFPIAERKTVDPCHALTFLGVHLDTSEGIASIPREKIIKYSRDIRSLLQVKETSFKNLKSIIGKLQFVASIIPAGRCFLRSLHDLTIGHYSRHSLVKLPLEVCKDLEIW